MAPHSDVWGVVASAIFRPSLMKGERKTLVKGCATERNSFGNEVGAQDQVAKQARRRSFLKQSSPRMPDARFRKTHSRVRLIIENPHFRRKISLEISTGQIVCGGTC